MAKILVIDDDTVLSGMVEDWLTYEKHAVDLVHLGFEGWKKITTGDYDLVVCDWDMPDLNGIDLVKRFRDGGGTTPIIMLTGHTSIDDKEQGLDSGANDYLTKPFHMKELSARIRSILRHQTPAAAVAKPLGTGNQELLQAADLIGTSLPSRYEFIEAIGEGGAGRVYKARHPHLDKIVAIKTLLPSELNDEMFARFEREAKVISKLEHPNIVNVYDFGITEKKQPFMVMEFIDGKGADQLLVELDYIPIPMALEILVPIADGIAAAHESGILHRDIKPSNIMVKHNAAGKLVPKLLDFGLAKNKVMAPEEIALTKEQNVIGSPPYMSPEQIRGKPVDERSDVYSFGCVLFEMLTGYCPHIGDTSVEILIKHLEEPPLSFKEARPDFTYPPELEYLVDAALQKDVEKRIQNMRVFEERLRYVAEKLRTPA
jgi:CheY-like chemotaxis protein